ncbi:MAG: hypothetical protein ACM3IH_06840 [Sphingobacteriales bacterium]
MRSPTTSVPLRFPTFLLRSKPSLQFDGLVGLFGPPGIADDVRTKIAESRG